MYKYRMAGSLVKEAGILSLGADLVAKVAPKIESFGGAIAKKVAPAVDKVKPYGERINQAMINRGYTPNYKHLAIGAGTGLGATYLGVKGLRAIAGSGNNSQQNNPGQY